MMAAEQDELFLKQNPQNRIKGSNRVGLCNIFDLTTLLLGRLQHLSGSDGRTQGSDHKNNRTGWVGSICHKTVANLEHLLRCLQRASLEALISDKLKIIEAEISGWHQYWQLSRTIFQGWFSEWPNGQRPLNTTWPWNVRPSLVVLWGVCWMFFDDHSTRRTRKPPPPQPRPSIYPQQPVANSSRKNHQLNLAGNLRVLLCMLMMSPLQSGIAWIACIHGKYRVYQTGVSHSSSHAHTRHVPL